VALFGGFVCWLPALLIALEAVSGLDALARVHPSFLYGNIVVGVVLLAIGVALARRFGRRSRLADALSGRAMRRIDHHLAELAKFQRED
jgi:hypothetical protein